MHLKEIAYAARQFICRINLEVLPLNEIVTILLINYICFYNYKKNVLIFNEYISFESEYILFQCYSNVKRYSNTYFK